MMIENDCLNIKNCDPRIILYGIQFYINDINMVRSIWISFSKMRNDDGEFKAEFESLMRNAKIVEKKMFNFDDITKMNNNDIG